MELGIFPWFLVSAYLCSTVVVLHVDGFAAVKEVFLHNLFFITMNGLVLGKA